MPMMYQYSVSINGGGNALAADFEKNNDGAPRVRIRKGRGTLQWWFCRDSSEQNTGGKKYVPVDSVSEGFKRSV